jgi:(p)ppGpp synthase/HD superfamily hydrolase
MEDEQMPERLLYAETSGRNNVERPRSRWLDKVNTDARRMGIRIWCRKALDREEWRKLLMESKTLLEL